MGAKSNEGGGGQVGRLWRKHGGGFYALMAVGTFVYLEVGALVSSVEDAETVQGFVTSELLTFAIESFVNTLQASFWPFAWYARMGTSALSWAVGGYLAWAFLLAMLLNRREKELRRALDL